MTLLPARLALVVAVALVGASLTASAQEMRPGRYKTTMKVEGAGQSLPVHVDEDCVTQRDIDEGLARLRGDEEAQCKQSDMKRGPGSVSYKMTCVDEGRKSTGEASGKFSADSFDFNMTLDNPQAGGKPMRVNIRGTRVGECGPGLRKK